MIKGAFFFKVLSLTFIFLLLLVPFASAVENEEPEKYTGKEVMGYPVVSQEWINANISGAYAELDVFPGVNVETKHGYRYIPIKLIP